MADYEGEESKMKKYKVLPVLAAMLLVAALLAACAGDGAADTAPQGAAPGQAAQAGQETQEAEGDRIFDISIASWVMVPVNDNSDFERRIERYNPDVNVTFTAIERAAWHDIINVRVAAGDIPDIIYRDDRTALAQFVRQGIVAQVPYEMIAQHAPDVWQAAIDYAEYYGSEEVWVATYVDGNNWGIPLMQGNVTIFTDFWRMDMLEQAGITEVPTTIAEAEVAFEAIINTDFGNGVGGTWGTSWRGGDWPSEMWFSILGAHGTFYNRWFVEGDSLRVGRMRDEMLDALETLNRWYESGFIHPEFVVTTYADFRQQIAAEQIAFVVSGNYARYMPPAGSFYTAAVSGNPYARLVASPPLTGVGGHSGYQANSMISAAVAFGRHLPNDPALFERSIQLVNFLMADTDENQFARFGEKYTDWVVDEETGVRVSLHTDPNDAAQFAFNVTPIMPIPSFMGRYRHNLQPYFSRYTDAGTLRPVRDYVVPVIFFADPEIMATAIVDAEPILISGIHDIIRGIRPVSDFHTLRDQWYANGGQRLTDEINRAYREFGDMLTGIEAELERVRAMNFDN
jgi:putative aldouronate transport system substrate-binding protein